MKSIVGANPLRSAAASEHRVIYTHYGPQPVIPSEPVSPESNYFGCHLIRGEKRGACSVATRQVASLEVGPNIASGSPVVMPQCMTPHTRHWAPSKKKKKSQTKLWLQTVRCVWVGPMSWRKRSTSMQGSYSS